jgi:hypothetical protein
MKFVTVASAHKPELRYLLDSCDHFGIQMDLVGMGRPFLGNGTKIVYLREYFERLDPQEIVCFTDAYDSFFVKSVDTLEADFKARNQPFVLTAEDNFYFRLTSLKMAAMNRIIRWKYPKSGSRYAPYRFLNSGGFIGYAGHILRVLNQFDIDKTTYSDQPWFHMHFVNHPEDMALDYNHDFFAIYGKYATKSSFAVNNDHLVNNQTGSSPYIFHFPGFVHRGLSDFSSQFSFMNK